MGQDESVVDDADEQRADNRAEHRADAAVERGAADNRGRDGLQLQPFAERGQGRTKPQHLNDAGESQPGREQSTKQTILTAPVGMPIALAASI